MDDQYKEKVNKYYDGNLSLAMYEKKNKTSIEIDFSGEELLIIARKCIEKNITFSEFIDETIKKFVEDYIKDKKND